MRFCNILLAMAGTAAATAPADTAVVRQLDNSGYKCVSNEKELIKALDDAKDKEVITMCKGSITLTETSLDLTSVGGQDVKLVCEVDKLDECIIVGSNTPNLFIGTPNFFTFEYISFSNKGSKVDGACHNYKEGHVCFSNCLFAYCETEAQGGAIFTFDSVVRVDNSTFRYNYAKEDGGAIFFNQTIAAVTNTIFAENKAGINGGAIYDSGSPSLSLLKVSLQKNTAGSSGGAVFLIRSEAAMYDVLFSHNRCETNNGGGIYAAHTYLAIAETTFLENYAKSTGGGIWVTDSYLSTIRTIFEKNVANGQGGAIYDNKESHMIISQCFFLYNVAATSDGGAINLNKSVVVITGSDFTGNAAHGDGGAIDDDKDGITYITLADSTFVNNGAERDGGCVELDRTTAVFYKVDMSDNIAHNNGGCLNVLDTATVTLVGSNFKGNDAHKLGDDIFIRDVTDTSVICKSDVVFCDGVSDGIKDDGHIYNTNCDKAASDDGDFCADHHPSH
jgi:predicted outer membrane repeat protein